MVEIRGCSQFFHGAREAAGSGETTVPPGHLRRGGSSSWAVPAPLWWPCSVLWTAQAGSHPGTLLWVCQWQLPRVWERVWELDEGQGLDLGPPSPLQQGVQVDPTFWAAAADLVSLGRERSPSSTRNAGGQEGERDLLFKRSCFFSHPCSLFINLTQFHNSQTCKAAGLFLFCLNLSEPAKFLRLARGAASTMAFQGLLGLEVCRCFLLDLTPNEEKRFWRPYLFIFRGKMWFKMLIIMFYMNYSDFMWLYGKMNAHQFKKNSLFIKHSYLKWSVFFSPPLLNENRVSGVLQIIMFFNYIEFCIRILEDGPLWSSGENTRAFQKLYNYLFSLLLSLQYTHSNWKKEKKK